jgi:signal transduction histidine kinase
VRESDSALERARAKLLLWGTLAVLAIPLGAASGYDRPGVWLGGFSLAAGLLPLPVGYAIARYRLFDLGLAVRRGIAYLLCALAAGACAGGGFLLGTRLFEAPFPTGDPVTLFALAFAGFLAGEPLRTRLRRAIDGWLSPGTARMRAALEAHASRIAELLDPDACARSLCAALRDGLEAESVGVFLSAGSGFRLVDAHGRAGPLAAATAAAAAPLLADAETVHLADEERHRGPDCAGLREQGLEVVARLGGASERLGIVLIGRSHARLPYTSAHLGFLRSALSLTAVAAQRAGLAHELMLAERFATLGRIGAGLVHDLGKSLGVVETLAARLSRRPHERSDARRDASTIAALAAEMRLGLRAFLGAARPDPTVEGETGLDALIDRAVRMSQGGRTRAHVAVRLAPGLPRLRAGGDALVRVIANLVDNASQASVAEEVVSVSAVEEAGRLCIEVSDRGCGMDAELAARAFEPFFTTRAAAGGSGLGLPICRDLVASLGGSLELASAPGTGTRVRVWLPLAPSGGQHAA